MEKTNLELCRILNDTFYVFKNAEEPLLALVLYGINSLQERGRSKKNPDKFDALVLRIQEEIKENDAIDLLNPGLKFTLELQYLPNYRILFL